MSFEPITKQDIAHGLIYAAQSLKFTYNRMRADDWRPRFIRIRNGIIAENATERVLNAHDIVAITAPLRTDWRLTDGPGDIAILSSHGPIRRGDIKSLSLNDEAELQQKAWALVPKDQFQKKSKHIYITDYSKPKFASLATTLSIHTAQPIHRIGRIGWNSVSFSIIVLNAISKVTIRHQRHERNRRCQNHHTG